ncbi:MULTISPECIES: MaoC family dehydratase [Azospirillum]|uniref:N-terminal of MaoC-like dehydratase domain-containing protein n=1 Tax=Azospirillum himalayense TaxID=654847 RepID=A0ABW0GAY5_9PROT|nr:MULTISPECIES: MaoC family dehydratase [Azospirillum]MBY3757129.1 MaoC family dehydratase [Azospirillum formosense]
MHLFDTLQEGAAFGAEELHLSDALMERWTSLYPDDPPDGRMPAGMIAVATMRAYSSLVVPRPPGNIHGSQRYEMLRRPAVGERLTTRIACAGKELKRDRRWVHFDTETVGEDGTPCFRGRMTILWAA